MKPWLALIGLGACAWAQDKPALRARELFYTPPPEAVAAAKPPAAAPSPAPAPAPAPVKPAPKKAPAPPIAKAPATPSAPASVPLGLRYSLLKRNAAGSFAEVDPDSTFHSGDRIRLKVDANTGGYLYVVMQGSSGNWRLLFPSAEVAGGNNHVQRGETRMVPSGDRGQFVFDEQAGTEKLFVVLSRQPQNDLDKLIYSIGGPKTDAEPNRTLMAQSSVGNDVIEHFRQQVSARDLVFEKSDADANGKPENAAYVVNPSPAPDARLVVDISLRHQ